MKTISKLIYVWRQPSFRIKSYSNQCVSTGRTSPQLKMRPMILNSTTNATKGYLNETTFPNVLTSSAISSWNFTSIITLCVCVSGSSLNGFTLFVFLSTRRLRMQPFSMYLIFLLIYNFLLTLLQNPLGVVDSLYPTWWLGKGWCTVYRYAGSLLTALGMYTHVLVTISRLWAITFPLSYRRFHSRKNAVLLCLGMTVLMHMIILPDFVPKTARMRTPMEIHGCRPQYKMSIVLQFMVYIGAIFIITAAYPLILFKHKQRQRALALRVAPALSAFPAQRKIPPAVKHLSHETLTRSSQVPDMNKPAREHRSHGFTVLTLLTCSAIICWTPPAVTFIVSSYKPLPYPMMFQIVLTLLSIQPVMDPILFAIALKDLRKAIRGTLFCQITCCYNVRTTGLLRYSPCKKLSNLFRRWCSPL